LYVYVGNNPLEYIDPTGHGKETPEQEAVEEGAVGGVNNKFKPTSTSVESGLIHLANQGARYLAP
jgi:hypothetical protein